MLLLERKKNMKFSWIYDLPTSLQVKSFLKTKGISRSLLAKIKFHGGKIEVNETEVTVRYLLKSNDSVRITIPDEAPHETTVPIDIPIEIVYEDQHYLVVNKPYGVASVPSQVHPEGTMANRVKGYYVRQGYANQVIHIVTRLDRDTTGLMLFAKHGYAHALMDVQLRAKELKKKYTALIMGQLSKGEHGFIDAPIARTTDSIITRRAHESGKEALTEYWVKESFPQATLVDIQLHTGRTHQIRVHFTHIGHPLMGDDLYGGEKNEWIVRQALHCRKLNFVHPFTNEKISLNLEHPEDIVQWLHHHKQQEVNS